MPRQRMTKRAIDAIKSAAGPVFLWDAELPGFGVKVTPAGKQVFILQYRMGGRGSKTKRYTIGAHGAPWTLAQADKEARRLLLLVGQGGSPADDRQQARLDAIDLNFNTMADTYLAECVKVEHPKSYDFVERSLRLHVRPTLKGRALPDIQDADLSIIVSKIPAKSRALRRNVFAVTRAMFSWFKDQRFIKANPFADMKAPAKPKSRNRVLDDGDIKTVWQGMAELAHPFGTWAQMLLLLGQRRTEIASTDWRELRRKQREWEIPSAKTKNGEPHIVPLSDFAFEMFDNLAGGDVWPKRGLVFTTNDKTAISGFSKAKLNIDAKIAEAIAATAEEESVEPHVIEPWRYHDLRRTMATTMQRLRIAPVVIEACENRLAGESKKGSAEVYQRYTYIDEKRDAMQKWGEHLRFVASDAGSNVVPLALKNVSLGD